MIVLTDSVNLFCCFRWMLVLFKREFGYEDISQLWEACWSCPLTEHYDLFVALAILNRYRQTIMAECTAFDETLKFMNELSGKIRLTDILPRAEVLFNVFQHDFLPVAHDRFEVDLPIKTLAMLPDTSRTLVRVYEPDDEDDDLLLVDMDEAAVETPVQRPSSRTHHQADASTKRKEWIAGMTNDELWELVSIF